MKLVRPHLQFTDLGNDRRLIRSGAIDLISTSPADLSDRELTQLTEAAGMPVLSDDTQVQ
jgi:hypothetical protein